MQHKMGTLSCVSEADEYIGEDTFIFLRVMMEPQATRALTVIVIIGLIIQGMKVGLEVFRTQTFERSYLRNPAGFPSLQSGISASIVTIIFLEEGLTLLFVATLVFAGMLRYDSIRLRTEAEKNINYLTMLQNELLEVFSRGEQKPTNDRIGHTVPEVLAGVIVGVALTTILYII